VRTGSRFRPEGMVRLALYATPICLAGLVGLFYFTYFEGGADGSSLQSGSVQLSGSETMRPVVTTCAEDFMTRDPKADIIVKGGGSGDGIAALLHGIVDIGMMSRELSQRERDYAASKDIQLAVSELALDGVTIIVNRAIAVTALGLGQLQAIFAGRIRNWRELQAGDAEVLAFARADGSGTASLFADRVLRDEAYAPSVQRLPSNEAIVAEVATRPAAIGYTDFGALRRAGERVRAVAVRLDPESAPVLPSPETIRSRSYPLAQTLHFVTAGNPAGTARAFLDFCSGAGGEALLRRAGYVGIERAVQ
jgi:phosphate transport system substrate-binding protein